jgi:hypothetical protein
MLNVRRVQKKIYHFTNLILNKWHKALPVEDAMNEQKISWILTVWLSAFCASNCMAL